MWLSERRDSVIGVEVCVIATWKYQCTSWNQTCNCDTSSGAGKDIPDRTPIEISCVVRVVCWSSDVCCLGMLLVCSKVAARALFCFWSVYHRHLFSLRICHGSRAIWFPDLFRASFENTPQSGHGFWWLLFYKPTRFSETDQKKKTQKQKKKNSDRQTPQKKGNPLQSAELQWDKSRKQNFILWMG